MIINEALFTAELQNYNDNTIAAIRNCKTKQLIERLDLTSFTMCGVTEIPCIAEKLVRDWRYNSSGSRLGLTMEELVKITIKDNLETVNMTGEDKGSFDEVVLMNETLVGIQVKSSDNSMNKQNTDGYKQDVSDFISRHKDNYDNVMCVKLCTRGVTNKPLPVNGVDVGSSIILSGKYAWEFITNDSDYCSKVSNFVHEFAKKNQTEIEEEERILVAKVTDYLIDNCTNNNGTIDIEKVLAYTSTSNKNVTWFQGIVGTIINGDNTEGILEF